MLCTRICGTCRPLIVNISKRMNFTQVGATRAFPASSLQQSGVLSSWLMISRRELKVESGHRKSPQHARDGVPATFSLIYESSLKNFLTYYYIAVAATGTILIPCMGYLIYQEWEALTSKDITNYVLGPAGCLFIVGLINYFTRRFYSRIYFNTDTGRFIAVRRSFFGRMKQLNYTSGDIKVIKKGKPEDGTDNAFVTIKKTKCQLACQDFVNPMYYNMHLGMGDRRHDDHVDVSKSYVEGPKF